MTSSLTIKEYRDLIRQKYPVVIGGYSGLQYENTNAVCQKVEEILTGLVSEHSEQLLVVSGGTEAGIGVAYKIAKELGLPTLGIVSEQVAQSKISRFCDSILLIADSERTWEVKSPSGESYLVKAAENGCMYYFGGGEVAVKEILEAKAKGVPVTVFPEFLPDEEMVKARLRRSPGFERSPTRFI